MDHPKPKPPVAPLTTAQKAVLAVLLLVAAVCAVPLVGWLIRVALVPLYRWGFQSWL